MFGSKTGIVRSLAYPAMDGLRFYAAFVVFMVHLTASAKTTMPSSTSTGFFNADFFQTILAVLGDGHHGVDFFFVISGFLMGRHLLAKGDRFSYTHFLQARFKRIYPAFLVSYVAAIVCDLHFGWTWKPFDAVAGLFFLNAIPSLEIIPYHYVSWSIGFEFAFYIAFPVILLLPSRIPNAFKAGAICLGFFAATVYFPEITWLLRMTGLFAGLWLSTVSDSKLNFLAKNTPWYLAILPYLIFLTVRDPSIPIWSYVLTIASAVCVFVIVVYGENPLSRLAQTSVARFLGTISYSFYLWHTMCISASLYIIMPAVGLSSGPPEIMLLILAFLSGSLAILVSYASYLLTEKFYFRHSRVKVISPVVS